LAEAKPIARARGRGASRDGRSSSRRGPETRAAIHRAAVELFARRGYHATSMRAMASAARVQPAAIYHWYSSKEAILVQLQDDFMEQLTDKVEGAMARQGAPALKLAAAVREHVVFHGLYRAEAFVTDSEIRALRPGPRRALVAKRDAYQEIFRELIAAGVTDGSLHATDERVATYAILLECTGVALWFDPEGPLSLEQVAELHVELVLGSLQATPELISEAVASVSAPEAVTA
jgi:AcrR family transcriptional regulator